MAVITTTQTLHDGVRNLAMQFTGRSDAAGQENKVVKVDVGSLTPPCAVVKVLSAQYEVSGGILQLYWDEDDPKVFLELAGANVMDYGRINGLVNGADPTTRTGNILFSTVGFDVGSSYSIKLDMIKKYA